MNDFFKKVFFDMEGTLCGTGTHDISTYKFYPFSIDAIEKLNKNTISTIVITKEFR